MGKPDTAALLPVAESIADGSPVDWDAVEGSARAEEQSLIRQLRLLSELATLHRTLPAHGELKGALIARRTAAAPAIGRWAHLDLIERIGGGAYGDVYRAWDRQLERDVALKLLRTTEAPDDPQDSRILTEGRLLARVRHPNVVTVHGVAVSDGRVGLWMELVGGSTLEQGLRNNGPFSAAEAAVVGIDLCRALAAIHKAGLIHRDVKAQNVLREEGGRIVLMDLGTGREVLPAGREGPPDLAGTPLYLAPEIFSGAQASERTDLFSLGVLLYRLVTGSFPVQATTIEELKAAHVQRTGRRLRDARADLPTAFVRVIDRAIASDPGDRYASAGELEADLARTLDSATTAQPKDSDAVAWWRVGTRAALTLAATIVLVAGLAAGPWVVSRWRQPPAAAGLIRSIAVLPLVNLSGDPSQEYFADGMTDALIDNLAKIRALRVISRTSMMQFKGTSKSLRDVANALNVDAVLEGSVVKSGDRVRISASLVHVATDRHVWVDAYDRDLRDVLALQSEVARAIAREIQIQLTPIEQAGFGVGYAVNTGAEEAYLQGRYFWNKRTDEGFQKALDFFRQAAALDPTFARAYAGQADVYNLLPGRMSPFTAYPLAKDAANRALALDPTLAEAHTSLAFATFIFDRDWAAAEAAYTRALQLNPGYATAHHWYGDYLSAMGRGDEAIGQLREAKALDPLSSAIGSSLGDALYMARRYDEAIIEYRAALEVDGDNPSTHLYLALTYLAKGMPDEASTAISQGIARVGATATLRLLSAAVSALRRERSAALRTVNEMAARGPEINTAGDLIAYVYICLGDNDHAFEWLARAEQARAPGLLWAKVEPIFDPIRNDPRFEDLLLRLRLAP